MVELPSFREKNLGKVCPPKLAPESSRNHYGAYSLEGGRNGFLAAELQKNRTLTVFNNERSISTERVRESEELTNNSQKDKSTVFKQNFSHADKLIGSPNS